MKSKITLQINSIKMTGTNKLNVVSAVSILKSGGVLENVVIADLTNAEVNVVDALLLAENGFVVPDGNIIYNDNKINYDSDFDAVTWGKPMPFKDLKTSILDESSNKSAETEEIILKIPVKNVAMKKWLKKNQKRLHLVIEGMLESMYKSEETEPKRRPDRA